MATYALTFEQWPLSRGPKGGAVVDRFDCKVKTVLATNSEQQPPVYNGQARVIPSSSILIVHPLNNNPFWLPKVAVEHRSQSYQTVYANSKIVALA
jgi:hypothetical protein